MKGLQSILTSIILLFGFTYSNFVVGQGDNIQFLCSPSTSIDTVFACTSHQWINGKTYTASNNSALDTIVNGATNGCDSIVQLYLTIGIDAPTIITNAEMIAPNLYTLCVGEFATFENVFPLDTTIWYFDGAIASPGNVSKINPTQFNNTGLFSIETMSISNQCGDSRMDTFYILVNTPNDATGSGNQTICQHDSVVLTIDNLTSST